MTDPRIHRASREPLSKERILRAALEIADSSAVASVTMRNVAGALHVEAMSLYNHVTDKSDLLNGIIDLALAEIDLGSTSQPWREGVRELALSAYSTLMRHRWASELILAPGELRIVPARLAYIEAILAHLRHGGFSTAQASRGYHALDSHILGFTLWQLGHALPADAPADYAEQLMQSFDMSRYPFLAEHAREHLEDHTTDALSEFSFGLELILDGLERLRPQS